MMNRNWHSKIVAISLLILFSCDNTSKWGNKIDFINELKIEIDSLEMTVCKEKTMLYLLEDFEGEKFIEDNPVFPKKGYPCPVKITVFSKGKSIELIADTFDCYHCDVDKYYVLKGDSARFQTQYKIFE